VRKCLLACWLLLAATVASAERQLVDGIVAQVGNEVVLFSEVIQLTAPSETKMRDAGAPPEEILRLRAQVLERLIDRRLVEEVISRANLEATDAEVDQAIEGIAEDNGLSMAELQASVEAEGLGFAVYREEIRGEIERARIINSRVRPRVNVDEVSVQSLYEVRFAEQPKAGDEVRLEELLVSTSNETDREAACSLIEEARGRADAGEAFSAIAEENPALRFTELDWIHQDQLVDWMLDAVIATEPGEIGDPLPTSFGCALIHLIERRHIEPISFEQAEPRLYDELYNIQMEREYRKWLDDLRKETYIERKGVFAERDEDPVETLFGE